MESVFTEEEWKDVSKFLENKRYLVTNLNDGDLIKGTENKKIVVFLEMFNSSTKKNCKNCQNKYCDQAYSGYDKQKMSLDVLKSAFWLNNDILFIIFHAKDCISV